MLRVMTYLLFHVTHEDGHDYSIAPIIYGQPSQTLLVAACDPRRMI